jgi:hypothetical protein
MHLWKNDAERRSSGVRFSRFLKGKDGGAGTVVSEKE